MKKNGMFYGAVVLTIAGLISKFLGAFYRVPLLAILGSEGLGMYQLVFPIFALMLVVGSSGVPLTLSKQISSLEKENEHKKAVQLFRLVVLEVCIFSSLLALAFVGVGFLISPLQGNDSLRLCYFVLFPALILSCILSCFKGYYQGLNNMLPSSITQVCEQFFKLVFSILLASLFIKKSLILAVFGALMGISISEIVSLLIMLFIYYKKDVNHETLSFNKTEKIQLLKNFNKELFPITFSNVITPLFCAIDSILIVGLLSNAGFNSEIATRLFGINNGMIASLISLPTVLSTALATSVVPVINNSDEAESNEIIKISFKIIFMFCLPIALLYVFFGNEIAVFMYSSLNISGVNQVSIAGSLLKINGINTFYMSFIALSTCILQIKNKSKTAIKNLLLGSVVKLVLSVVLVSNSKFNIYGLAISDVVGLSLTCVKNLYDVKNIYPIHLTVKEGIFVPVLSCSLTIIIMKCLESVCYSVLPNKMDFIALILLGVLTYIVCVISLKSFSREELSRLTNKNGEKKAN